MPEGLLAAALWAALLPAPALPARRPESVEWAAAEIAEGRLSDALEWLEDHLEARPGDAAAWRTLGDGYCELARQWLDAGSDPSAPLFDAKRALEECLRLGPDDAALATLVEVLFQLGEYDTVLDHVTRAAGRKVLSTGEVPPWLLESGARAVVQRLLEQDLEDPEETRAAFAHAHAVVRNAQRPQGDAAAVALLAADLLQWAGLFAQAVDAATAALPAAPGAVALHQRLIDLHFYHGVVERLPALYDGLREVAPADPTVAWYRGYSHLLVGDAARREGDFGAAREAYTTCQEWLARSAALKPGYADSARRMSYLADLGLVGCELPAGDLEPAAARLHHHLVHSADLHEIPDGLQRTLFDALDAWEGKVVATQEYETALPLARQVGEVQREARWFNNLGFFLREYGTQIEQGQFGHPADQRKAHALAVFEESWQAYQTAAELAPEDARIVNDAALIQAYHLRTELPRAREMFERAILRGEQQLAELGAQPERADRFPLAQAVGDAYQNLGVLAYHVDRDHAAARRLFERARATDTGVRETIDLYLAHIEGRGDPVPDPFATLPPELADVEPPLPAELPLVSSFESALARAAAENRPVLVYYRGEALADEVPSLDALITRPRFVRRVEELLCVLADPGNHTFVERDRRGRRVLCPVFPGILCRQHRAAQDEFLAWWDANGTADQELVEAFYYVTPDGRRFVPPPGADSIGEQLDALQQASGASEPAVALETFVRQLEEVERAPRERAAEQLLDHASRAARDHLELLLFDPSAREVVRETLLQVLARRPDDPTTVALFPALVRQQQDPALALLAARHWPAELDTQPLRHAVTWTDSETLREAAARHLARSPADRRPLVALLVAGPPPTRAAIARALGAERDVFEEVLLQQYSNDPAWQVRMAVCESLTGSSTSWVREMLEEIADSAAEEAPVRAAARRALQGGKGW